MAMSQAKGEVDSSSSFQKKKEKLNRQINRGLFYFNPVYKEMLKPRYNGFS